MSTQSGAHEHAIGTTVEPAIGWRTTPVKRKAAVRNVFVLGLDKLNSGLLSNVPELAEYRFHPLLSIEELQHAEAMSITDLIDKAQRRLESFGERIDAIISWWDFPATSLVPILCNRFNLPAAPLSAVLKCEDKFWSRLEQQKVITEMPRFGIVDLEGTPQPPPGFSYPMWLKPVKSYSSVLAFKVHDRAEFDNAATEIKRGGQRIGRPFDLILSAVDCPPEVAAAGGEGCLVEEAMEGSQLTVEGFCSGDRIQVYGIVDSFSYPGVSSFLRYQYPSRLPEEVQQRLVDVSTRVVRQIGLQHSTFNIEYFWDAEHDRIMLLEINPRVSQSHARLFHFVDGMPNLVCTLRLALGEQPDPPHRQGPYNIAGKWFLRHFSDGLVRRVPTKDELTEIEHETGGVIHIVARQGARLSDLPCQDSYSYELANLFLGAEDEARLVEKYEHCLRRLRFAIEP